MQMSKPIIRGAGGKGGGGGGQELPDSLRSTQTADVLDLLSEGEVEGLTKGLKSIYLDGVPLQNADDSFNFEGVQVQVTPGTQGQPAIAGADGVLNEVGVGVAVLASTPLVRSVANAAVDRLVVTIEVQQLTRQDSGSGDLAGSAFEWAIDVQSNGGGYVTVLTDLVEGKTTSRYTRSKEFALTGSAPWDVRVRRITADSTSSLEVNAFRWSSYTEIQSLKLRYPNSALVRLRVGAQQFSRIPVRSYDLMGMRVRVPTNYDTRSKVYTGVWDGTFKVDWTDCPAWIYYDVVTNNRYGLGRYFQTTAALKWRMYSIGRYCDEMVPDGRGGTEPRFRCGLYITTREQAYKVVADLAAIFRGMAFWAGTDLGVMQDAPQDPVALYTNSNVLGGKFVYAGASHSKRHSQVVVWFNSLAEFGKLVPEVVVDRTLQARYGVRSLELSPLGIWSRGQAQRLGKWVLYSEQREGAAVSFGVGLDGVLVAPGAVFEVADSAEAGERLGGRVRSATAGGVTLDNPVTLAAGEAYTLSCMLPDPLDAAKLMVQVRPVSDGPGVQQGLTVSPPFTQAPAAETVWLLQSTSIKATTWRCLGVAPVKGKPEFEISAIRHEPQKYGLIEQGITFEARQVSRIKRLPTAPASLAFTETVYALGQERRSKATISWPEPAPGYTYLVSWRLANGPWTDMPPTSENCVDIDALAPGLLEVSVKSRNALGALSQPRAASYQVQGNQVVLGSNLIDSTWWKPGAAWEWELNTDAGPGVENAIVWGVGPKGEEQALWRATASGPPFLAPDGGWDGADERGGPAPKNLARIDTGRTYRFALPVMRVSGTGPLYWGPNWSSNDEGARVCALNTSNLELNPYFFAADLPATGKWYLMVGYVFPEGSTGVSASAGGLYDMATMERVGAATNYCWKPGVHTVRTRAYQYYASAGAVVLWAKPTVELVDGTESGWTAGPRGITGASSITLVTGGTCTTPGPDRIRKATGADAWDSEARSLEGFVNGAWCSWQCEQTNKSLMVGLNADPATNADYTSIDYAWYCASGVAQVYLSGAHAVTVGGYTSNSVFSMHYDGQAMRFFLDGGLAHTVAAAPNQRLHLDSSFFSVGGEVRNVRFGPVGAAGLDGADAKLLTLLASAQAFTFDGAASPAPGGQVITLTALLANLAGPAVITATGYDASGASLGALAMGGSGNTKTLGVGAFGAAAFAVVQASAGGYVDQVTLVRLKDGQNSIAGYLTNEAHVVATEPDGSGGNYSTAGGDFKVFNGLTELNAGVAFSVVAGSVTGITGLAIGADGVYSLTGLTVDVGTAILRAAYGAVTIDKVYTISRTRRGVDGIDGIDGIDGDPGSAGLSTFEATVYIQQAATPAAPTGGSYNFGTSTLAAPAGFSVARPAFNPQAAIWATTQRFSTTTPGATVAGGAWSTPVKIDSGAASSAAAGFFAVATTLVFSGTAYASVRLHTDGTVWKVENGVAAVQVANWYLPTTAGIGSQYSVAVTSTGPSDLDDPTVLLGLKSLASAVVCDLSQTGFGDKNASVAFAFIKNSTGLREGSGDAFISATFDI